MDRLLEVHDQEGKKRFKKRWDSANVGWFIDEVEKSISSKVYGDPCMILTTTNIGKGKYLHEENTYR